MRRWEKIAWENIWKKTLGPVVQILISAKPGLTLKKSCTVNPGLTLIELWTTGPCAANLNIPKKMLYMGDSSAWQKNITTKNTFHSPWGVGVLDLGSDREVLLDTKILKNHTLYKTLWHFIRTLFKTERKITYHIWNAAIYRISP